MTTLIAERHLAIEADDRPAPPAHRERTADAARGLLDPLMARAAALDLDDAEGWAQLRSSAHATLTLLRAAGWLPPHLDVGPGDPPVVIARTIAVGWRQAGTAA
jgi:hypothetical protein